MGLLTFDPDNNYDRFMRSLGTSLAGERNEDSTTGADYTSVVNEATYTIIAAATIAADTTTVVSAVPAILYGYHVTTAIGTDVITFDDASTVVITTSNTEAVGTTVLFNPGIRFETSLNVNPTATGTGGLTVFWRVI